MTRAETALLLAMAAAHDNRRVDEAMVAAWHDAIGDLSLPEAREALRRHYRATAEWVMPAHILQHARAIREEQRRLSRHEARALPSRFERDTRRDARVREGVARCREAIAPTLARLAAARKAERGPESQSDAIRERALEMARAHRRKEAA